MQEMELLPDDGWDGWEDTRSDTTELLPHGNRMPSGMGFFTVSYVSNLIGLSEGTVTQLCEQGELFHWRVNGEIMISDTQLTDFVACLLDSLYQGNILTRYAYQKVETLIEKEKRPRT